MLTLNAAEVALALAAAFLSLLMALLSWSMKGLIDNAKAAIVKHDLTLDVHSDRLNEHGRKVAVLEVRINSHESSIGEMRTEMSGIAHRRS